MGSVQQNVISYRGNPLDPHTLGSLVKRHAQAADVKKVEQDTTATPPEQVKAPLFG